MAHNKKRRKQWKVIKLNAIPNSRLSFASKLIKWRKTMKSSEKERNKEPGMLERKKTQTLIRLDPVNERFERKKSLFNSNVRAKLLTYVKHVAKIIYVDDILWLEYVLHTNRASEHPNDLIVFWLVNLFRFCFLFARWLSFINQCWTIHEIAWASWTYGIKNSPSRIPSLCAWAFFFLIGYDFRNFCFFSCCCWWWNVWIWTLHAI